jgi:hypothetical protein
MIDAQTNPVLLADFIAPSPDVLLIIGAMVPYMHMSHKRLRRSPRTIQE